MNDIAICALSGFSDEQARSYTRELERIRKVNGRLDDDLIVESARKPDSVLHDYFEWDVGTAAQLWLRQRAQQLIRQIAIAVDSKRSGRVKIRLFVRSGNEYQPLNEVPSESATAKALVGQCRSEIVSAQRRLDALDSFFESDSDKTRLKRAHKALSQAAVAVQGLSA
jgi:hypothetical protein